MKLIKRLIIIALIVLALGAVLAFSAFAYSGFDINELDGQNYRSRTESIDESFSTVKISATVFDVRIAATSESAVKISCFDGRDVKTSITVNDGTLNINVEDGRAWYEKLLGGFGRDRTITVYLPSGGNYSVIAESNSNDIELTYAQVLSSITLKTDSGDIDVVGASVAGAARLTSSSGDIELNSSRFEGKLALKTKSGEISAENSYAKECTVSVRSGDVELENFDTEGIDIESSSGDIEADFMRPMNYRISTKSGRAHTPASDASGAPCTVRTKSGDVMIGTDD